MDEICQLSKIPKMPLYLIILADNGRNQISLSKFKTKFEVVLQNCSSEQLQFDTHAYLLYVVRRCIVADNSLVVVPAMYLQCVDLHKIDNYAWGAAAFVILGSSLNEARTTIKGFTYALLVRKLID